MKHNLIVHGASRIAAVAFIMGCLTSSVSAFLIGSPTFSTAPNSQIGPITGNTLTITPLPNGMSVAGQIQITVPAGNSAGILLNYVVDYPIDPTYTFNPAMFTLTSIDGFSLPPPGAGNSGGNVKSVIVTLPSTELAPSVSSVPLTLINGFDNPPWTPAITATSGTFPFAGAPNMVLRQSFFIDANYSGPGGTWILDFPVITLALSMPEPSMAALFGVGGLVCWRSYRKRRTACLASR